MDTQRRGTTSAVDSVSDQLGGDSPAVRLYNVQKIPANFLIDREGNIVRRNVPPTEIEAAVKELL